MSNEFILGAEILITWITGENIEYILIIKVHKTLMFYWLNFEYLSRALCAF